MNQTAPDARLPLAALCFQWVSLSSGGHKAPAVDVHVWQSLPRLHFRVGASQPRSLPWQAGLPWCCGHSGLLCAPRAFALWKDQADTPGISSAAGEVSWCPRTDPGPLQKGRSSSGHLCDSQALGIRRSVGKALGKKGKGNGPASCSLKISLERWLSPALHPEVAFAPTECEDFQRAELLSFCSLWKDLEGAAGRDCWRKRKVSEGQSWGCSKGS